MLKSHSIVFSDFESEWYDHWAKKLKQTVSGKGNFALKSNKFWQNAVMVQALFERNLLESNRTCIGFGVGKERLPTLFASMGIKVTATDQDFTKQKAKEWSNDQLAHGAFSLNEDGICEPDLFNKNVDFMPLDMNNIPAGLNGKYDFLWSNCALGHLGSIEKGLNFIEESLRCLKPGGWAVHTTEINITSDDATVDSGNTVIFRIGDIYDLYRKLTEKGFICAPFHLLPANGKEDQRVTLDPVWGTDYTKILVGGHIATQIVIMINAPVKKPTQAVKLREKVKHYGAYKKNRLALKKLINVNPTIKLLEQTKKATMPDYKLEPVKKLKRIGKTVGGQIIIEYVNKSEFPLTGIHSLSGVKPLVLGTDNPVNHVSPLANKDWSTPNRPAVMLARKKGPVWNTADYIKPGEKFGFIISVKPGSSYGGHTEDFSIIQEGGGVVPNTKVRLEFLGS